MTDDVSDRIEELEAEVAALRETVEQQQYTVRYLAADADLDPLEPSCPHCGEGEFVTESGISWKRVRCSNCGHSEYL
jgi:ribosomal protein S27AE